MAAADVFVSGNRGTALPHIFKLTSSSLSQAPPLSLSLSFYEAPVAAEQREEVIFPTSGNQGRHHCHVDSDATRASPSPLSSPEALSSSHESIPPLNFAWDLFPMPLSAGVRATGDSVHTTDHGEHRSDRPDLLSMMVAPAHHGVPRFTGADHRSSASVLPEREAHAWTAQT